jgi:hypothetical protein
MVKFVQKDNYFETTSSSTNVKLMTLGAIPTGADEAHLENCFKDLLMVNLSIQKKLRHTAAADREQSLWKDLRKGGLRHFFLSHKIGNG